jgi:hypothetical protein
MKMDVEFDDHRGGVVNYFLNRAKTEAKKKILDFLLDNPATEDLKVGDVKLIAKTACGLAFACFEEAVEKRKV